jgi:hypothetical protein
VYLVYTIALSSVYLVSVRSVLSSECIE